MKVRCIDGGYDYLIEGGIYSAIKEDGMNYYIRLTPGTVGVYCKKSFEVVEKNQKEHKPQKSTFEENITNLSKDLTNTLIAKNSNYGNSFYKSLDKYGNVAFMIRLEDKINRLGQLINGEHDKVGESLEDTLKDIAGYSLLMANYIKNERK